MNQKPARYFMYLRKYPYSLVENYPSLESQERELIEMAEREELNIVGIYKDFYNEELSAKKTFHSMLNRIARGGADGILVWKLTFLTGSEKTSFKLLRLIESNEIRDIKTLITKDSVKRQQPILFKFNGRKYVARIRI